MNCTIRPALRSKGAKSVTRISVSQALATTFLKSCGFSVDFERSLRGSRLAGVAGMKGILGIAAAVVLVFAQLAGLTAWRDEPAIYLAPVDSTVTATDHRA